MFLSIEKPSLTRVAAAAALAALAFVILSFVVRTQLLGPQTAASALRHAAAAQSAAGAFEYRSIGSPLDSGRLADSLIALESARRGAADDPAEWAGAVRCAVEFLNACAAGDPLAYEQWAYSTHQRIVPESLPLWGSYSRDVYEVRYALVTGHAMPADITPAQYFREYFAAFWSRGGSELKPAQLAIDQRSIEVKTAVFTHWGDSIGPALRADGLGPFFWFGGAGAGAIPFLVPEHQARDHSLAIFTGGTAHDRSRLLYEDLLRRHGPLTVARVSLVYRSHAGLFVPAHFLIARHPDEKWAINEFIIANVGADVGVGSQLAVSPIF